MSTAPWNVSLPRSLTVGGEERSIRTDYRVALDIFLALSDPELDDYNRLLETLDMLYIDELPADCWQEAIDQAMWYLRGGEDEKTQSGPKLVSWEQDFQYIAAPVSKVIGEDIRGLPELHWWTFLSAYMSIGDCLFAQIIRIRDLKARGKKLDKADREFYRRNRDLIEIKKPMTAAEQDIIKEWM